MVKPFLLDVNVLAALAWPEHVHHELAHRWFIQKRDSGFRTCPITQAGFVRISGNPRFTNPPSNPPEALATLARIIELETHEFWPDDLSLAQAIGTRTLAGYRQITDAYLLALAESRNGTLATLDRAVWGISGSRSAVELVHDLAR